MVIGKPTAALEHGGAGGKHEVQIGPGIAQPRARDTDGAGRCRAAAADPAAAMNIHGIAPGRLPVVGATGRRR